VLPGYDLPFFHDPLFIYTLALPYILAVLIIFLKKGNPPGEDVGFSIMFGIAIGLSGILLTLANNSPYFHIHSADGAFVAFDKLGYNMRYFTEGLLKLFNSSFFGLSLSSSITALLNCLLLFCGSYGLILLFFQKMKQQDIKGIFISLAFFLTGLIYVVSNRVEEYHTTRYIIFMPFLFIFGLYYFIKELVANNEYRRYIFFFLIIVSIFLNLLSLRPNAWVIPSFGEQYRDNIKLIDTISRYELAYGYGEYWDSTVNTYISREGMKIRQVVYNGEKFVPYRWLACENWYDPRSHQGKSFLLLNEELVKGICEGNNLEVDRVDYEYLKRLVSVQFGEPEKSEVIVTDSGTRYLFVFDYNISSKF